MERVWRIVADYQWWFYGFLGLLLLFYLRRAVVARRQGARSIFKLEKEQARGRYGRSVIAMIAILLVVGTVFGLTNYLLPSLNRTPEPTPTATSGPLPAATLTPTVAPSTITPTPTATKVLATPTPRFSPTPAIVVSATPVVRPPSCPNPGARLTSPGTNQVVRGSIPLAGTANVADFQYYKIEVGPGPNPSDNQWGVVGQLHYTPVDTGVLETFNSDLYPPGVYTLRLVVVDRTGNYPEPCRVTVTVQR